MSELNFKIAHPLKLLEVPATAGGSWFVRHDHFWDACVATGLSAHFAKASVSTPPGQSSVLQFSLPEPLGGHATSIQGKGELAETTPNPGPAIGPEQAPRVALRPLDFVTLSQIESLDRAATGLWAYARARGPAFVDLIKTFSVPDPLLDRDSAVTKNGTNLAYYVYGPRYAPRLFICWGFFRREDDRFPFVDPDGDGLHPALKAKLQQLLPDWRMKQKLALELMAGKKAPLADFIACPEGGSPETNPLAPARVMRKVRPILYTDKPVKELRSYAEFTMDYPPLERIWSWRLQKFEAAAKKFYAAADETQTDQDEAGADASIVASQAFESDLRQSFVLPHPDINPAAYRRRGKRFREGLCVLYDPDSVQQAQCLRLVPDSVKEGHEPESNARQESQLSEWESDGEKQKEEIPGTETVCSALLKKKRSMAVLVGSAVALLVLLVGLFALSRLVGDHKPPEVVAIEVSNDENLDKNNSRNVLVLQYNDKLLADSLDKAELNGNTNQQFALTVGSNRVAGNPFIDPKNQSNIIVYLAASMPGNNLGSMVARGIRDKAGNLQTPDPAETPIIYHDTRPPKIRMVTSSTESSKGVRIIFDEPLNSSSANRASAYKIEGLNVLAALTDPTGTSVLLTASEDFATNMNYSLTIGGVTDRASNPVSPLPFSFAYRDNVPPQILYAGAKQSPTRITIDLDEPVTRESTEGAEAFAIDGPGLGAQPPLLSQDGRSITLTTRAPLKKGGSYSLTLSNLADFAGNVLSTNLTILCVVEDKTPPDLREPSLDSTGTRLKLPFSEELDIDAANVANYALFARVSENGQWGPATQKLKPEMDTEGKNVTLVLSSALEDGRYTVEARRIKDLAGNVAGALKKEFLRKTGAGYLPRLVSRSKFDTFSIDLIFTIPGNLPLDTASLADTKFILNDGSNLPVRTATLVSTNRGNRVRLLLERPCDLDRLSVQVNGLKFQGDVTLHSRVFGNTNVP